MFWNRYGKTLSICIVIGGALFTGLKLTVFAPYQVESVSLTLHDVQHEAFGVGTVEAKVVISVGSKITNRITALTVDQGDRVHTGQLLATLEDQDFKNQVAQAEYDLERAAADLVANQAAIKKAAADLTLARKNSERHGALVEEGAVSRLEFEQRENEHIVAQEAVSALRAQRTALEKQQQRARASVGFAKARLADTRVYAPCDGVVVSREAEAGDAVVAGVPLFRIADPSGWIEIVSGIDGKDKVAVASLDTLRRLTENSRITVQNGHRP